MTPTNEQIAETLEALARAWDKFHGADPESYKLFRAYRNHHAAIIAALRDVGRMREALAAAVRVADEARVEWDEAPSGMRAGKLLIALSGKLPGYRIDIDAIHAALTATGRE